MESRFKRILDLATQNVLSNVQLGQEPEEAPNMFVLEKSQNSDVPRRDSSSSSSSSSSSGPSYYEDSDDSVKDPDYQIIRSKCIRRIGNLFEQDAPATETDQNVPETEVRLASDPVLNTGNVSFSNMDVETEIGLKQLNERSENDEQLMNAMRAIYFKNSYADEDFKRAVVIKKRKEINVDVKKAYTANPGISQKKKADLMELVNKNLIPRFHRSFYESL